MSVDAVFEKHLFSDFKPRWRRRIVMGERMSVEERVRKAVIDILSQQRGGMCVIHYRKILHRTDFRLGKTWVYEFTLAMRKLKIVEDKMGREWHQVAETRGPMKTKRWVYVRGDLINEYIILAQNLT